MGDLLFGVFVLAVGTVVGWVAWRAGFDTATRHADYRIGVLRTALKATRQERDHALERSAFLAREMRTGR